MREGARTAMTIGVLGVLLVVAALWGWAAATKPFPGKADAPICVERTVKDGEKVYPDQVTVSVYNAGTREGLAGRTMQLFEDEGFGVGRSGNAPKKVTVRFAQIWSRQPDNPAVRLVASRLGKGVRVVSQSTRGVGVTVVVGDKFHDLVDGRKAVASKGTARICSPPVG